MLRHVDDGLGDCDTVLPSYTVGIGLARATLFDDVRMRALTTGDLELLRGSFATLAAEVRQ